MNIFTLPNIIIMSLILFALLPILEPFLAQGIAATGGITALLISAYPFVLVVGIIIYTLRGKGSAAPQPYSYRG